MISILLISSAGRSTILDTASSAWKVDKGLRRSWETTEKMLERNRSAWISS
ncbi:MAG: DUF927 domain-containing protein [Sphingobacterium sp.]|nr:DUF927 domain-containing protein [Sphingobacterium sp.]